VLRRALRGNSVPACPPLICAGRPAPPRRSTRLARIAVAAGSELAYHGDFDWPWVSAITAKIIDRHGRPAMAGLTAAGLPVRRQGRGYGDRPSRATRCRPHGKPGLRENDARDRTGCLRRNRSRPAPGGPLRRIRLSRGKTRPLPRQSLATLAQPGRRLPSRPSAGIVRDDAPFAKGLRLNRPGGSPRASTIRPSTWMSQIMGPSPRSCPRAGTPACPRTSASGLEPCLALAPRRGLGDTERPRSDHQAVAYGLVAEVETGS